MGVTGYAKPTLFLKEIKKNNLSEQFLGKFNDTDLLLVEVFLNRGVLFNDGLQGVADSQKQATVFFKKFFCDFFDIKCILYLNNG